MDLFENAEYSGKVSVVMESYGRRNDKESCGSLTGIFAGRPAHVRPLIAPVGPSSFSISSDELANAASISFPRTLGYIAKHDKIRF